LYFFFFVILGLGSLLSPTYVAGSCEHGDELSGSIRVRVFLEQLRKY
jgi:predicted deacylase